MAIERSSLEFFIKTNADLTGAKDTRAALLEAIKQTEALGKDSSALKSELAKVDAALISESASAVRAADALEKVIAAKKKMGADTSVEEKSLAGLKGLIGDPKGSAFVEKLKEQLQAVAGEVPGLQNALNIVTQFSSGPLGAIAGVGAVAVAALGAATKAVEEYAEAQERAASLDAALAQRGLLNQQYRESLHGIADELEKLTAIDDSKWIEALTTVTKAGADPSNINQVVEGIKNMAGLMNGDLQSAAQAVSRALNGNFQMFTRLGIRIDENLSQSEKLNKLWEELATRGGGQLEARAQTLHGQFNALKNATGDLFKAFGSGISETGLLQSVMYGLTTTLNFFAGAVSGGPPPMLDLQNAARTTRDTFGEMGKAAEGAQKQIDEGFKKSEEAANAYISKLNLITQTLITLRNQEKETALERLRLEKLQREGTDKPMSASEEALRKAQIENAAAKDIAALQVKNLNDQIAQKQKLIDDAQRQIQEANQRAATAEQKAKKFEEFQSKKGQSDAAQKDLSDFQTALSSLTELSKEPGAPSASRERIAAQLFKTLSDQQKKIIEQIFAGLGKETVLELNPEDLAGLKNTAAGMEARVKRLRGETKQSRAESFSPEEAKAEKDNAAHAKEVGEAAIKSAQKDIDQITVQRDAVKAVSERQQETKAVKDAADQLAAKKQDNKALEDAVKKYNEAVEKYIKDSLDAVQKGLQQLPEVPDILKRPAPRGATPFNPRAPITPSGNRRADASAPAGDGTAGALDKTAAALTSADNPAKGAAEKLLEVVRAKASSDAVWKANMERQIAQVASQVANRRV